MNEAIIKIDRIKIKDIYSYTLRYIENKNKDDIDFITKHRALAHSNNPYADKDDICMILAYYNNKCVGYLGLMPGIVRIRGRNENIIWPTCIYISPELRGKSISTLLINSALDTNKALICTGMSRMVEPVFQHLKFKPLKNANFSEIDFRRLIRCILPIRIADKILRTIIRLSPNKNNNKEFVDTVIYRYLKKFSYKIINKKYTSIYNKVIYKEVPFLDESFRNSIALEENSFPRPLEWINWMLQYKWVLSKDESDKNEYNYYFSNTRENFYYKTLINGSSQTDQNKSFIIFSVSKDRGNLKVKLLDHTCKSKEEGKHIAAIILKYAKELLADSIEISADVVQYFDLGIFNKILFLQREWRMVFLMSNMSNKMANEIEKSTTNYCDGDIAFV